jgi:Tfp pilus assembly protein PilE
MKLPIRILCLLSLGSLIGWLSAGCRKDSLDNAVPQTNCRIQEYKSVTKSAFYEQTNQTVYTYDSQGNLSKTAATMDKRPPSGTVGGQTGTTTGTYTYNADGYLTASASQELYITVSTPTNTIREQITTTRSYSYANGRLSGYTTTRVGAYGITTTTTDSFLYDESGNLLSKTEVSTYVVHDPAIAKEIPTNPTGPLKIWTYRANVLVDYVEKSGASEQRPLTIQNGLVLKITGTNYEVRYEYDNQQRLTKQEFYADGNLTDSIVQTWTNTKPSSVALPVFKGFPTAAQLTESGQAGVLASRKSFYWNSTTKTMEQYDEITYTMQTNAQEFITSAVILSKHPNPAAAAQDFTTTETYTYSACQ